MGDAGRTDRVPDPQVPGLDANPPSDCRSWGCGEAESARGCPASSALGRSDRAAAIAASSTETLQAASRLTTTASPALSPAGLWLSSVRPQSPAAAATAGRCSGETPGFRRSSPTMDLATHSLRVASASVCATADARTDATTGCASAAPSFASSSATYCTLWQRHARRLARSRAASVAATRVEHSPAHRRREFPRPLKPPPYQGWCGNGTSTQLAADTLIVAACLVVYPVHSSPMDAVVAIHGKHAR